MKTDKYLEDWLKQIISHDNILHALTHGGYMEDCEPSLFNPIDFV